MVFRNEYWFLSNFYPVEIKYNGLTYKSVEAAFQAQKTLDECEKMLFTSLEPNQAKSLGRKVHLRKDWNEARDQIMLELLKIKFSNPELAKLLIETGDKELVEDNSWNDTYWGRYFGEGLNILGLMLMVVRKELQLKEEMELAGLDLHEWEEYDNIEIWEEYAMPIEEKEKELEDNMNITEKMIIVKSEDGYELVDAIFEDGPKPVVFKPICYPLLPITVTFNSINEIMEEFNESWHESWHRIDQTEVRVFSRIGETLESLKEKIERNEHEVIVKVV